MAALSLSLSHPDSIIRLPHLQISTEGRDDKEEQQKTLVGEDFEPISNTSMGEFPSDITFR